MTRQPSTSSFVTRRDDAKAWKNLLLRSPITSQLHLDRCFHFNSMLFANSKAFSFIFSLNLNSCSNNTLFSSIWSKNKIVLLQRSRILSIFPNESFCHKERAFCKSVTCHEMQRLSLHWYQIGFPKPAAPWF